MSTRNRKFKAARWQLEILTSLSTYQTINAFLVNPDALNIHFQSRSIIAWSGSENDFISANEEIIKRFNDNFTQEIVSSSLFYNRQMIVLSATYIELILKDFLTVVFQKFPDRMFDFLYHQDKQDQKGLVSLKEIIKSESIEHIISTCADQASSNALKGKISSQLKNISKVINIEIDKDLRDKVINLVQQRNRIVHENSQESVEIEVVSDSLDVCLDLLKSLSIAAYKSQMALDDYHPYIYNLDEI